jgi:chromosome segregation ATPase
MEIETPATPQSPLGKVRAEIARLTSEIAATTERQRALTRRRNAAQAQIAALSADSPPEEFTRAAACQLEIATLAGPLDALIAELGELQQRLKSSQMEERNYLVSLAEHQRAVQNAADELTRRQAAARQNMIDVCGQVPQ